MRLALRIAYDGTCFHGSARQPDVATVEGAVIERLREMDAIHGAEAARFQAAARTDAGVSAAGNVVAFDTGMNPQSVVSGLAYGLERIWPLRFAVVPDDFAPRHAVRKTYRYYLYDRGYDRETMRQAARRFEGIDVVGKSFLWQQVRRMVAALRQVGRGMLSPEVIRDALRQPSGQDFGLAAPEHLLLLDVEYTSEPAWSNAPGAERLADRLHDVQLRVQLYEDMHHTTIEINK